MHCDIGIFMNVFSFRMCLQHAHSHTVNHCCKLGLSMRKFSSLKRLDKRNWTLPNYNKQCSIQQQHQLQRASQQTYSQHMNQMLTNKNYIESKVITYKINPFKGLPQLPPLEILLREAIEAANRKKASSVRGTTHKIALLELCERRIEAIDRCLNGCKSVLDAYPIVQELHPFDRAVMELALNNGVQSYREGIRSTFSVINNAISVLQRGRKKLKNANAKQIESIWHEAAHELLLLIQARQPVLNSLRSLHSTLHGIQSIDPTLPTAVLVGAPNVGKSSIVRAISSGKPQISNYSFTTRGVIAGHMQFVGDTTLYQVTDTPGLLPRADDKRNAMELLTLTTIQHMDRPIVVNVIDPSGHSGWSLRLQLGLRAELRARFPQLDFVDVLSKADLGIPLSDSQQREYTLDYLNNLLRSTDISSSLMTLPIDAIRISTDSLIGIEELKQALRTRLLEYQLAMISERNEASDEDKEFAEDYND